jgi:hypothetical protein
MAAFLSTGLQTTPSSDLRGAESSPREGGIGFVAIGLAISVLLLAGWLLLRSAPGLQTSDAVPSARPEGVIAPQDPAPLWRAGPARLPREWTWQKPALRVDTMFREPR